MCVCVYVCMCMCMCVCLCVCECVCMCRNSYTSNDLRATTCTNGKVFCFLSIVTRSIVFVFTVHKGVCAFSREGAGKVAGTAVASSLNVISKRVSIRRATSFRRVSPIDFTSTSRAGTANATSGRPMMMVIEPSGGHGAPL